MRLRGVNLTTTGPRLIVRKGRIGIDVMKTNIVPKSLAIMAVASMAAFGFNAGAQQTTVTPAAPAAVVSTAAPALPYGVPQILQLAQAKIGDDTVIAYVKNSGNSYNL